MSIRISERRDQDVTIVDLRGQLTLGESVAAFREFIEQKARLIAPHLLINLGGLNYLDSAGLGELTAASHRITACGGIIKLLNVNLRIGDLLSLTRLYTVFETFDDEENALATFAGARVFTETYYG
jgi:anti-sigma B factor antagonist